MAERVKLVYFAYLNMPLVNAVFKNKNLGSAVSDEVLDYHRIIIKKGLFHHLLANTLHMVKF